MYYQGKRIDTFEPAMYQLMANKGMGHVSDFDCASLRAFGFRADETIENWFCPFIETEDSIWALRKASRIPFSVFRLNREKKPELPVEFVLGPVRKGVAAPDICEYYYNGRGRYLFVRKLGAQYEVYDPHGFPGLQMSYAELSCIMESSEVCCVYLEPNECIQNAREFKAEILLKHGLRYHDKIQEMERTSIDSAARRYVDSQSGRIALRHGMLNLIQMLDKVFGLAGTCGLTQAQAEYVERKQKLFHMAEDGIIVGLSDELSYIWEILRNYER